MQRKKRKKGRETLYFNFKPRNWILNFVRLEHSQLLKPSKVLLLELKHYFLPQHKKPYQLVAFMGINLWTETDNV